MGPADHAAAEQNDTLGIEIKYGIGAAGPADDETRMRSGHAKSLDPQIDGQIDAERETLDYKRSGKLACCVPGCLIDTYDGRVRMLTRRLK